MGSSNTGYCVSNGAVVGGTVGGSAGGIVAEAGSVAIALGIMRLGARHDSPMAWVGGLLLVAPFVSLAGYLLLLGKTTRWIRQV